MYYQSVGRNANLMFGAVPNGDRLIPEADSALCGEMGWELRRRLGKPLAEMSGLGRTVELGLPEPARIDHVVIMEDIVHGQRVRSYVVEGLVPGNTWRPLDDGVSIGHKRIQQFDATEIAKLRLRTTVCIAETITRRFAGYARA